MIKTIQLLSVLCVFSLLSTTVKNHVPVLPSDDYIYDFVDQMPEFPGGKTGLNNYIQDNLHFPNRVKKAGITGKVFTEFIVEKNGEISNQKVYKGLSTKLEKEALKLISNMPNWIPGKNKGKVVRVKISLPLEFK